MTKYTIEFEMFWKAYPKRWNRDLGVYVKRKKWPAFEKWQKLSQAIRNDCLAKARYIKATEGTPRDCVTWLNQRGWDDIELAPLPKALPAEITPKLKKVESCIVNVNNERNKQIGKLAAKGRAAKAEYDKLNLKINFSDDELRPEIKS